MMTTRDLADAIGVTPDRILRIARNRKIEPIRYDVGVGYIWRDECELELQPGPPGNPNFGKRTRDISDE